MNYFYSVLFLISVSLYKCIALETSDVMKKTESNRSGRTYDKYFNTDKSGYGDEGDNNDDRIDDNLPNLQKGKPSQAYPIYKVNNYPPFGFNNKGQTFYQPSFKGGFQFPSGPSQSDIASMNGANNDKEEGGFLTKFVEEKPMIAAAIIPLSIVTAAVVPVLMKFMATSLNPPAQPIQTTATNKKDARRLNEDLDAVLGSVLQFTKSMDCEECVKNSVCRVAAGEIPLPEPEYVDMATSVVAHLINDDRINNVDVKYILAYLKKNNCDKEVPESLEQSTKRSHHK